MFSSIIKILSGQEEEKRKEKQTTQTIMKQASRPSHRSSGSFGYDIGHLAIRTPIQTDVSADEFSDMEFLTEGSNSHIFSAKWRGQTVIIKMLQVEKASCSIALNEFQVEMELLCRMNHRNVIRVLGAGQRPRPFIIIERLRCLNVMLGLDNVEGSAASFTGRQTVTFTLIEVLRIAKDLADGLDYCHNTMDRNAMIIHRDLKPENIGLAADGRLKLFDFGLCRCVQKRRSQDEVYEMTGNTGSLRYMAPEVVLHKAYNEKVDVFSFAIVIWTIAKEKVPYKGYDRATHKTNVIIGGERPRFDTSWPQSFCNLLDACWHRNIERRPSMSQVSLQLAAIIESGEATVPTRPKSAGGFLRKLSDAFMLKR